MLITRRAAAALVGRHPATIADRIRLGHLTSTRRESDGAHMLDRDAVLALYAPRPPKPPRPVWVRPVAKVKPPRIFDPGPEPRPTDLCRYADTGITFSTLQRWARLGEIRIWRAEIDGRVVPLVSRAEVGAPHARDRRRAHSAAAFAVVVARLAAGERLAPICRDIGIPITTVKAWMRREAALEARDDGVESRRGKMATQMRAVLTGVRGGLSRRDACASAGVSGASVDHWLAGIVDAGDLCVWFRREYAASRRARREQRKRAAPVPDRRNQRAGIVYFVRAALGTGPVKIGFTGRDSMEHRLAELQIGSPTPLVVLRTIRAHHATESWLHVQLREDRSHGEWFHPTPRILAMIAEMPDDLTRSTPDEMQTIVQITRPNRLFHGTP